MKNIPLGIGLIAFALLALSVGLGVWVWNTKGELADTETALARKDQQYTKLLEDNREVSRELKDCKDVAQGQKDGLQKRVELLKTKKEESKAVATATPFKKIKQAIRKKLVEVGALDEHYANVKDMADHANATKPDPMDPASWVIQLDSTEGRAVLEATGMVEVKQKDWDDLAKGFAQSEAENVGLGKRLAECKQENFRIMESVLVDCQGFLSGVFCKPCRVAKRAARQKR